MCARRTASRAVAELLRGLDGVEQVLDEDGKRAGRPRPSALRRAGGDLEGRPLVQLLLLARRRARARLRAHRRYPPQARLRPGRAVRRSGDPAPAARRRLAAREAKARHAHAARRDLAQGHAAGEGLARPADRRSRRRPARHQLAPDLLPEGEQFAATDSRRWCFARTFVRREDGTSGAAHEALQRKRQRKAEARRGRRARSGPGPAISSASSSEIAAISVMTANADVARAAPPRQREARRAALRRARARTRSRAGSRRRWRGHRRAARRGRRSGQRSSDPRAQLVLGDVGQADQVAEEQHRADPERRAAARR